MQLRTLGKLALDGSGLSRPKPLLLLAYLTLEGPRPRRFLGELFWPGAANPTNSLAVVVRQIRQDAPGALHDDESRLWADLPCDALDLELALRGGRLQEAVSLYGGAFLDGAEVAGWGTELEEWAYARREVLGAQLREAALTLAEAEAAAGRFGPSADLAERAMGMAGAAEPGPEFWVRAYPPLLAGNSPLLETARRQAGEWDLKLDLSPDAARTRLRQSFVGRRNELERLRTLPQGGWAWLRGGAGLGKTSVLRRLEGQYLPARSGLPYATLEPLLGPDIQAGDPASVLRRLAALPGTWLLDGWEAIDPESRELLAKLRHLGGQARVVVTLEGVHPFAGDLHLELGALTPAELSAHGGAYEVTGGLPGLVGAWLRGEQIESVLEVQLSALPESTQQVFGALALLDMPDIALVRQALGLDAPELAAALDGLLRAGLIESAGQVRGRAAELRSLEARPLVEAGLALKLARVLDGPAALPLFRRARALWEEGDQPRIGATYLAWATETLRRGFPQQAADALDEVPPSPELTLLRARSLEQAGQFTDGLRALEGLAETPQVCALKAALMWRLGRSQDARRLAEIALDSDDEARAEALNTLAHLDFQQGQHESAEKLYRRAASLWRTFGDQARWAGALNNRAAALSEVGDAERAFQEALEAAGENLVMRALTTLNLGLVREKRGDSPGAAHAYAQAAQLAQEAGSMTASARAWNNLGALHHRAERVQEAQQAYEQALEQARLGGEKRLLGMIMANLAELTGDPEAYEEALRVIEKSGNQDMLARYQAEYKAFIARSPGGAQA